MLFPRLISTNFSLLSGSKGVGGTKLLFDGGVNMVNNSWKAIGSTKYDEDGALG